ncbi:hypothetical protein I4U23_012846 [Adineta vaga]|nr:hypothetical protein I4U23_012846 [Adineta vaga]
MDVPKSDNLDEVKVYGRFKTPLSTIDLSWVSPSPLKSIFASDIEEQAKSSVASYARFYRSLSEFIRHRYKQQENLYEINDNVPLGNGT